MALRGRQTGVLGRLVLCGVIWLASFGALYQVSLRSVTRNTFLLEYWSQAFMPLPPRSIDDLKWFPTAFFSMFRNPGGFVESGLGAALFLIGLFALARRDLAACAVLVLPMLLALLASGLGQFPFGERVILFLTPALMLLIAQGVEVVRRLTWRAAPIVTIALLGCLVFDPLFSQVVRFLKPRSFSGAREALSYLADHAQAGEGIYLYSDSISLFRYYAPRFGLEERATVLGIVRGEQLGRRTSATSRRCEAASGSSSPMFTLGATRGARRTSSSSCSIAWASGWTSFATWRRRSTSTTFGAAP